MMVYDIVCRNSQNGNGQVLYTFDQVSYEVKMERCLIIPRFFLALMIFFINMCFK